MVLMLFCCCCCCCISSVVGRFALFGGLWLLSYCGVDGVVVVG